MLLSWTSIGLYRLYRLFRLIGQTQSEYRTQRLRDSETQQTRVVDIQTFESRAAASQQTLLGLGLSCSLLFTPSHLLTFSPSALLCSDALHVSVISVTRCFMPSFYTLFTYIFFLVSSHSRFSSAVSLLHSFLRSSFLFPLHLFTNVQHQSGNRRDLLTRSRSSSSFKFWNFCGYS